MERLEIVIFTFEYNYDTRQEMYFNGKHELSVHGFEDCPEDAIIGRDLVSCTDIANYMLKAVGKEVVVKWVEGNPDEMSEEVFKEHLKFN